MSDFFNHSGMSTSTTGTGTITLGSALGAVSPNAVSYQSFAAAGVANGKPIPYLILDSNGNWELGIGTYTSSGTTLSRGPIFSSNSNAAITLTGVNTQVFITAMAAAGGDWLGGFSNPLRGFDTAANLQLNASVSSNLLTIAVKGNNGNDPSPTNPILIPFRDSTIANGGPIWVPVTSALSINTNATGATLGVPNSTPFRFWIVAFNNGGTVVLALINCFNIAAYQIFPLSEDTLQSSTAISGSATSVGVFYTPNGTTISSSAFRILGFLEYSSGLATSGTYSSAPTKLQLFGPGVRKPGDVVQSLTATSASPTSVSNTTAVPTSVAANITPISAPNLIRVTIGGGGLTSAASSGAIIASVYRNASQLLGHFGVAAAAVVGDVDTAVSGLLFDAPGTTSSTNYTVYIAGNSSLSSAFTWNRLGSNSVIQLEEIMS